MRRTTKAVGDVARLPDYSIGPTAVGWWGVVGFMLVEGAGFVLALGTYFYLIADEREWPPAPAPDLLWGTLFLLVMLGSEVLNVRLRTLAGQQSLAGVRIGLITMILVGLLLLVLRGLELTTLNVRWDQNAYGSIVWAIMTLHTLHLITDVYDTGVAAALAHRKEMTGRRFSEIDDNCLYWHFIVWSWAVLYLVVYWVPRWL